MYIIKSYQDVIEHFNGDMSDLCVVVFDKKNHRNNFHKGHEYVIEYAQSNFKYTLIVFGDTGGFTKQYYQYNKYKENDRYEPNYLDCYNWCVDHNIDFIWWQESDFYKKYNQNLDERKEWVEELWREYDLENCVYSTNTKKIYNERIKARMIFKKNFNLNWTYLSTWKDGFIKLYDQWFSNNFTKEKYILIDPIRDEKGLYYSREFGMYNSKDIKLINELCDTANIICRENIDDIYKQQYRKFYANGIKLKDISITTGIINPEKILVTFTISKNNVDELYPIMRSSDE